MAKQRTTKAAAKRPAATGATRNVLPIGLVVAAAVVIVAAAVWARPATTRQTPGGAVPEQLEHIHGLGIDPVDGTLYAATHHGVFRVAADGTPTRVGQGKQDTMGFTVAGPNHFLGSGHPAAGENGPAHLGLIESTDAGNTWTSLSMRGQADFHALRLRHDTVYGYNSVSGQLLVSKDRRTWQARSTMQLRDFAVSPTDPNVLLATTQAGLVRSTDGGRTWAPSGGSPVLLLDWERQDRLWGVTTTGDVVRSADGGGSWSVTGRISGTPAAFVAGESGLYLATGDGQILHSGDQGATWAARER